MSQNSLLMPSSNNPLRIPLVKAIDHCSLIVVNTRKALEFYSGILALEIDESRPDLGYPGAWLQVGDSQIHLLEVADPYSSINRPVHGGRDYHVALQVFNLEKVILKLEAAGISYSKSKSGRAALFCRDFDDNTIELVEVAA